MKIRFESFVHYPREWFLWPAVSVERIHRFHSVYTVSFYFLRLAASLEIWVVEAKRTKGGRR